MSLQIEAMAVAVVEVAEELAPLQDKDLKVTVERMLLQSSERKRKGSIWVTPITGFTNKILQVVDMGATGSKRRNWKRLKRKKGQGEEQWENKRNKHEMKSSYSKTMPS